MTTTDKNRVAAAGIIDSLLKDNAYALVPNLPNLIVARLAEAGLLATTERWYRGVDKNGEVLGDEITIWSSPDPILDEAEFCETEGALQAAYLCNWVDLGELYVDDEDPESDEESAS